MRSSRPVRAILSALCAVAIGPAFSGAPSCDAQTVSFQNQTGAIGLVGGQSPTMVPDSFLAGGTVGDFSGDGFQDIFVPGGGGQPDRLFINDGDGTFTESAAAWGIVGNHGGTAASAADYDGDGDVDLFVNSYQGNRLYQNQGGSFTNVAAAAGVAGSGKWGAAFGDYDLDGDLDLAVVDWPNANANRLFSNDGDGTFTDVTAASGVTAALNSQPTVVGFTVRFADMDGDRYPELLWVGDFGTSKYLRNNGNGTFTRVTHGVGLDGTEMGHCVADFDRDGDFDWYVTTINTNNLYRNNGGHNYTDVSGPAGVQFTGWGWAAASADFDHDGRVDIAATSQSSGQFLYRNVGAAGTFNFSFWNVGFTSGVSGRGLATFDADNDGDQDLIVFPRSGSVQYFENNLSGTSAHWLKLNLSPGGATDIAPHGAGATVTLVSGGETQLSRVDLGSNYLSQSEIGVHFGVGAATTIDSVTINWANGMTTVLTDVAADQTLEIEAVPNVMPPEFIRGDANDDGVLNIADPIAILGILFSGDPAAACADAVDVNDDGNHDISDPISALGALFSGGVIPSPAGACGVDPTDTDPFDCNGVSCP